MADGQGEVKNPEGVKTESEEPKENIGGRRRRSRRGGRRTRSRRGGIPTDKGGRRRRRGRSAKRSRRH